MHMLLLGATLLAGCLVVGTIIAQLRLRRHRGLSRDEFIAAFTGEGVPAEVPAAVYDYYKKQVISTHFSVSPDDSYEHVFNEAPEDIDDDALYLMKKLGLKPPSKELMIQWSSKVRALRRTGAQTVSLAVDMSYWGQPILTLREMVLWLDHVRRQQ